MNASRLGQWHGNPNGAGSDRCVAIWESRRRTLGLVSVREKTGQGAEDVAGRKRKRKRIVCSCLDLEDKGRSVRGVSRNNIWGLVFNLFLSFGVFCLGDGEVLF